MPDFDNTFKCLDCRHCFKKNPLFLLLKENELDYLNDHRLEVKFRAGEIIFKQGSPLTHVVILNSGLAKIYIEGPTGRNLIINYAKTYEINASPGMYVDLRHHCTMMALVELGACFIEINAFKEVLRWNPTFSESFFGEFSKRVLHAFNHFVITTQKNMEGRIADAILFLKEKVFDNGTIRFLSKQDLADLTGMTKESAIRVVKEFKQEGLVEEGHHTMTVLNDAALQRIAELS